MDKRPSLNRLKLGPLGTATCLGPPPASCMRSFAGRDVRPWASCLATALAVLSLCSAARASDAVSWYHESGELVVEILSPEILLVGWGSPGNLDTSVTPGTIGADPARQFDSDVLAYFNLNGLTPGRWNLGPVLRPRISAHELVFSCGSLRGGDCVSGSIFVDPDPDFDGNGRIDGFDFLAWQQDFGRQGGQGLADATFDGDVDQHDYYSWQARFGEGDSSSTAVVPEASTFLLACLVGGSLFAPRRSRGDSSAKPCGAVGVKTARKV